MRTSPLALAGLLAACSSEPAPEPTANTAAPTGDNAVAAVAALTPAQQRGVLFRAVRDAGLACQQVTEAKPDPQRAGVWQAVCDNGSAHLVAIGADGTATVISRAGA